MNQSSRLSAFPQRLVDISGKRRSSVESFKGRRRRPLSNTRYRGLTRLEAGNRYVESAERGSVSQSLSYVVILPIVHCQAKLS